MKVSTPIHVLLSLATVNLMFMFAPPAMPDGDPTRPGPSAPHTKPREDTKERFTYQGPSYRALQRVKSSTGPDSIQRIYVTPGKTRIEFQSKGSGAGGAAPIRFVVIQREDLGVQWTLFPAQKTFREDPYAPPVLTKTLDGTENRDGRLLYRYRYRLQGPTGAASGLLWEDERGVPHRMVRRTPLPDGRLIQVETLWERIEIVPLEDHLFELPEDYHPLPPGMPLFPG